MESEKRRLQKKLWRDNNKEKIQQYRIDNKEKIAKLKHDWKVNHKEEVSEYNKQYRLNNPDKMKEKEDRYRNKHRDELNRKGRERYHNNRDSRLDQVKKYASKHKKEKQEYDRKYRIDNIEKRKIQDKEYGKNHPEVRLRNNIKSVSKIMDKVGYTNTTEYNFALLSWSKSVKKRDNNTCKICGGVGDIAHHIEYKCRKPELSLDINNGVTLCSECHKDFHSLNGFK